jgi:hypothetical protein
MLIGGFYLQALVDQIEPAVAKVKDSAKGDVLVESAIQENGCLLELPLNAVFSPLMHDMHHLQKGLEGCNQVR